MENTRARKVGGKKMNAWQKVVHCRLKAEMQELKFRWTEEGRIWAMSAGVEDLIKLVRQAQHFGRKTRPAKAAGMIPSSVNDRASICSDGDEYRKCWLNGVLSAWSELGGRTTVSIVS